MPKLRASSQVSHPVGDSNGVLAQTLIHTFQKEGLFNDQGEATFVEKVFEALPSSSLEKICDLYVDQGISLLQKKQQKSKS